MGLRLNNRYFLIPPVYVGKFDADDIGPAKAGTVRSKYDGTIPFPQGIIGVHSICNTTDFIFRISRNNTPVVILQLQKSIITMDVAAAVILKVFRGVFYASEGAPCTATV